MNKKIILGLCIMFFWAAQYVYVPILPTYVRGLDASFQMIGIIGGAYGFTQMLLRVPLGIISDKVGKKKIFVIIGMLSVLSCTLTLYLFTNIYAVLAARLISGVASSFWIVMIVILIFS